MNAKELIERDDLLKAKALDEIFSNPQNLILPIINRFINFWTFRPNPIKNNITTNDYIMFLVWVPILIFYGYSFFVVKEKKYLYLDLLIIYSCLTILPFFGMPRFRFPIDSLIMIKAFECGKIIYNNRFKS